MNPAVMLAAPFGYGFFSPLIALLFAIVAICIGVKVGSKRNSRR